MKPAVNVRPSYYAVPAVYGPQYSEAGQRRPNMFEIREISGQRDVLLFTMDNLGDRMHNLLARGIPAEDAKNLFYDMDGQE